MINNDIRPDIMSETTAVRLIELHQRVERNLEDLTKNTNASHALLREKLEMLRQELLALQTPIDENDIPGMIFNLLGRVGEVERANNRLDASITEITNLVTTVNNTIQQLQEQMVIANNDGRLGFVTGERERADRSTDGMITVLPSGQMRLIGFERLTQQGGGSIQELPRIVGEVVEVGRNLTSWELAKHRLLEPNFQIIQISLYQELCDFMYVGNANNATARWWYRCNANGVRNTNGTHMRVIDRRGLFARCTRANAAVRPSADLPYDGHNAGDFIGDTIRNIWGQWISGWTYQFLPTVHTAGVISTMMQHAFHGTLVEGVVGSQPSIVIFDASKVVPTNRENRPASVSQNYYIVY